MLLRGVISHTPISSVPPPPKKCHPTLTPTISKLPPQESEKVASEVSDLAGSKTQLALKAFSSAESQTSEVTTPGHIIPLCLQLGASRGCINAKLRVVWRGHQPHMLQSVHMSAGSIGGGVGMSLLC